jgi:hypothetical protein
LAALAWLGRQGTRAIAALVFMASRRHRSTLGSSRSSPRRSSSCCASAFLRVDPGALRGYLGRPALVLAATAWTMLVIPVVFGASGLVIGLDARLPDLFLALMLQSVASP